jgi:hypothetical protein
MDSLSSNFNWTKRIEFNLRKDGAGLILKECFPLSNLFLFLFLQGQAMTKKILFECFIAIFFLQHSFSNI